MTLYPASRAAKVRRAERRVGPRRSTVGGGSVESEVAGEKERRREASG